MRIRRAARPTHQATRARLHGLVLVAAFLLLAGPSLSTALAQEALPAGEADADQPVIELALCLDTSGTMTASIDAARLHLWGIVDDLSRLEPTPRVRVALLTYGSVHNPRDSGWVRINTALTDDLDSVSRALFALQTGGSEEYVERAIHFAINQLDWSEGDQVLRLIFVLGDEEADQDPTIDPEDLATSAEDLEIAVHPVFAGRARGKDFETWRLLSEAVGVQVATLHSGEAPQGPATPVDTELATLGDQLSSTYVPFGEDAEEAAENQKLQDKNVAELGVSVAASRAITKAGPLYQGDWDLVDAVDSGQVFLEDVPAASLPPRMRAMTPIERQDYVDEMIDRRRELRERIRELGAKRDEILEAQRASGIQTGGDDLRTLVRRTVRERAEAQGIDF
jgi:hypothetical protein